VEMEVRHLSEAIHSGNGGEAFVRSNTQWKWGICQKQYTVEMEVRHLSEAIHSGNGGIRQKQYTLSVKF
jgi:hypothetical protein